jgi:hypothetical protein
MFNVNNLNTWSLKVCSAIWSLWVKCFPHKDSVPIHMAIWWWQNEGVACQKMVHRVQTYWRNISDNSRTSWWSTERTDVMHQNWNRVLGGKKVTIQGNWFDNNEKVQMDVNDQMCMDLISTIKNCFSCKLEPIHPLCSGLWRTIRIHQHNTRVTFKAVKTFQFLCQRQTHILNIHHVTGFSM